MTTLLFLLLALLVLQALGRPAAPFRGRATSWSEIAHRLADDVLAGARTLSRLAAARRDGSGRPWV